MGWTWRKLLSLDGLLVLAALACVLAAPWVPLTWQASDVSFRLGVYDHRLFTVGAIPLAGLVLFRALADALSDRFTWARTAALGVYLVGCMLTGRLLSVMALQPGDSPDQADWLIPLTLVGVAALSWWVSERLDDWGLDGAALLMAAWFGPAFVDYHVAIFTSPVPIGAAHAFGSILPLWTVLAALFAVRSPQLPATVFGGLRIHTTVGLLAFPTAFAIYLMATLNPRFNAGWATIYPVGPMPWFGHVAGLSVGVVLAVQVGATRIRPGWAMAAGSSLIAWVVLAQGFVIPSGWIPAPVGPHVVTVEATFSAPPTAADLAIMRGRMDEFDMVGTLDAEGDTVRVRARGLDAQTTRDWVVNGVLRRGELRFHVVDFEVPKSTVNAWFSALPKEDITSGKVRATGPEGHLLRCERHPETGSCTWAHVLLPEPVLTNRDIRAARRAYDPQTHRVEVIVEFTEYGGLVFHELTRELVGKRFAMVMDEEVISAPVIKQPIVGGRVSVSMHDPGPEASDEAKVLAVQLRTTPLRRRRDRHHRRDSVGPPPHPPRRSLPLPHRPPRYNPTQERFPAPCIHGPTPSTPCSSASPPAACPSSISPGAPSKMPSTCAFSSSSASVRARSRTRPSCACSRTRPRITSELRHTHIAQVYDFGRVEDEYYLALEYVPGIDLRQVLARLSAQDRKMPVRIALRITADVLSALHYAHTRTDPLGKPMRIVHRDVNPRNVMISISGEVKLIDFGVARARDRLERTETDHFKGKLAYMAPEQARGLDVDHRADVFALGLTLFEMLSGKSAFAGLDQTRILYSLLQGEIPTMAPRPEWGAAGGRVFSVVQQSLACDVAERFADAAAMREAVLAAADGFGGLPDQRELADWLSGAQPDLEAHVRGKMKAWSGPLPLAPIADHPTQEVPPTEAMVADNEPSGTFVPTGVMVAAGAGTAGLGVLAVIGIVAVLAIAVGWYVLTQPQAPGDRGDGPSRRRQRHR